MFLTDLAIEVFINLRNIFFNDDITPKKFRLREKRNTQDDPLDEYIANELARNLVNISCQKSPGPLISPDFVVYREFECNRVSIESLRNDSARIIACEVKKLERTEGSKIARSTGLDFNTTPPCGTIRIYSEDGLPIDIRSFYLFLCVEREQNDKYFVSALSLCDGDLLNEDFNLYLRITGTREKEVGLGTYGDGADRNRPMLIFSNPLGVPILDHTCTLIAGNDFSMSDSRVIVTNYIYRTTKVGKKRKFYVHKFASDVPSSMDVESLVDPFPQPTRVNATQMRGKFRIKIHTQKEKNTTN